jgi:hypothetical protein
MRRRHPRSCPRRALRRVRARARRADLRTARRGRAAARRRLSRPARVRAGACLALALALAGAPAAHAEQWSVPQLVSTVDGEQLAGDIHSVDISADGAYAVFETAAPNVPATPRSSDDGGRRESGGIYRVDVDSGRTELVAPHWRVAAEQRPDGSFPASDGMPAISSDGRWVAFTERWVRPDQSTDPFAPFTLWVRDMTRPAENPDAYAQVSIGPAGETIDAGGSQQLAGQTAVAAGGAISDDGRRVLFSDTNGHLYWRDLDAGRTLVVSASRDPVTGSMSTVPAVRSAAEAVLSGDGSTVAWASEPVEQVPMLADEPRSFGDNDDQGISALLWRRIADGPSAPTRRIAGIVDGDAPDCPAVGGFFTRDPALPGGPCDTQFRTLALPARQLRTGFTGSDPSLPTYPRVGMIAISHDGRAIAFAGEARLRGEPAGPPHGADLFLATAFPGDRIRTAVRRLTRSLAGEASAPGVENVALSPEGRYVAFTSRRVRFGLDRPVTAGLLPVDPLPAAETYVIDLQQDTLQHVTRTPGGGRQDGGPFIPPPVATTTFFPPRPLPRGSSWLALSADARRLVVASTSENLAPDGNEHVDAFVQRKDEAAPIGDRLGPELESLPAPGPQLVPAPDVRLDAIARPGTRGRVALAVLAPGRGALRATATSLQVGAGAHVGAVVARAHGAASSTGAARLVLAAPHRLARALRHRGGLRTSIAVRWTPAGGGGGALTRVRARFVLASQHCTRPRAHAGKAACRRSIRERAQ